MLIVSEQAAVLFGELGHLAGDFRGRNGARGHCFFGALFGREWEVIGNHRSANRLGRMRRPPAGDDAGFRLLVQDVPDGFGFAAEAADGADGHAVFGRFDEAVDSVTVRAFAGGDGGP